MGSANIVRASFEIFNFAYFITTKQQRKKSKHSMRKMHAMHVHVHITYINRGH